MTRLFTGVPFRMVSWANLFLLCVTVGVFLLLVKLGLWQYQKGEQKALWQASLVQRQNAPPLNLAQLLAQTPQDELTGFNLSIQAQPAPAPILLLDNQVYQGQVGYLAMQVFEISQGSLSGLEGHQAADNPAWILVELGFIGANKDRRILPKITPLPQRSEAYQLTGRVYQKQINPMSDELYAETGNPLRFQNLNLPALEHLLTRKLVPVVLQAKDISILPQPWQPVPMPAKKHFGYALQWFTMAVVFALMLLWLSYKRLKKQQ
ncbi:SURF1 family protein [Shewanella sp. SR44-3]|uniref:SURF1 family protein n=2 Tax=Shewanella TaxID=22 RepID=UPI001C724F21|nr:SURF1 family protein [Shewanella sp. SR44-3]